MAETISIRVTGADALAAKYGKLASQITDFSAPMKQSAQYLMEFFSGEVFASRGSVIGHPWPALNRKYAAYKAQKWPGRPPLIQTGKMQRSFASQFGTDYAKVYNTATNRQGQNYFDFHQLGTRNIPARVMMDVDRQRQQDIANFFAEDLRKKLSEAA